MRLYPSACRLTGVRAALAAVGLAVCSQLAHGDEIPRLTFAQLVDSIRANFEVTQTIKSYNGKQVEIHGFIIPAGPPDLSFFLLSRVSAMGNYCCEVPVGQDETVYVYAPKGTKILYDPLRVYKVRGAFEAGLHTDRAYGVRVRTLWNFQLFVPRKSQSTFLRQ